MKLNMIEPTVVGETNNENQSHEYI
uniref:Uncharacterized protein n=1 Tax=Arundo donax TaxID=35708 RepID=A0A0A8YF24_ARUDO